MTHALGRFALALRCLFGVHRWEVFDELNGWNAHCQRCGVRRGAP